MSIIKRVTEIPGPKSRALLARRQAAVSGGLGRATDVVVDRAEGALVHDVDGNTLIDLVGGIGMLASGHCPEAVVEAVKAQAERLLHPCALVTTYEPYVRLAELLNEITPGDFPKKTLLSNSGAEAVENAVKLARAYTGRPAVVCFEGGYHGRTLLTMSLTSKYSLFKKGFGPFAPEIYRLRAPDPYRKPAGLTADEYDAWCVSELERAFIAQVDPSAVAAILIEPVQGEAGFIPMPAAFLKRIRSLCDQHGMVMIADEVQAGFGRTGELFAIEHYGIVPDLVTTAKSMGAGLPISAVTGRAEILDAPHFGGVGGTYGGSPIACVAAIAAIEQIRNPAFLNRSRELGRRMRDRLESMREAHSVIGDIRGLGPMLLLELVGDRSSKTPLPDLTLRIIKRAVSEGVMLIRAGLYSNCIRLMPPLVITDEQIDEALAVLSAAISEETKEAR